MAFRQPPSDAQLRSLRGRSVLITGGALGIGHYAAMLFAEQGAYVTIADTQPSEPVINSFKARSLAIQYVHCDVGDWSQQVLAFKQAIAFAPSRSLDIVCSFAAIDTKTNLADYAEQTVPTVSDEPQPPNTVELDTNLCGTLYTVDLALHYFRLPVPHERKAIDSFDAFLAWSRHSEGKLGPSCRFKNGTMEQRSELLAPPKSLVLVSSISGWICSPYSVYAASQFGIRGLFGGLIMDMKTKKRGVCNMQCNLIAPYLVRTPGIDLTMKSIVRQDSLDGCKLDMKASRTETAKSPEILKGTALGSVWTPHLDGTVDIYDVMRPEKSSENEETPKRLAKNSLSKESASDVTQAASRVSPCKSEGRKGNEILTEHETFLFTNTLINCCTNSHVTGHAWAITPYGVFDFRDEAETDDLDTDQEDRAEGDS